ncbi:hypothetical protein B0H14DRAFT_2649081 [Mycena olivaceomarginata]|nr:hypothetical protein B0H14DRAFT_2649081 [Mycena olivaceomarginata]
MFTHSSVQNPDGSLAFMDYLPKYELSSLNSTATPITGTPGSDIDSDAISHVSGDRDNSDWQKVTIMVPLSHLALNNADDFDDLPVTTAPLYDTKGSLVAFVPRIMGAYIETVIKASMSKDTQ